VKATWRQAFLAFFFPVFLVMTARWLLIEPYVIPSGSMIPTLLINDHIMVNKLAYGVRFPFSKNWWLVRWADPVRDDVVVFRYPLNPEVFYVKRVAAVPGETVEVQGQEVVVGPDEYYVLGDNRDNSSDSRYWGMVPKANIIGRASLIWLSCEDKLPSAPFICNPQTLRASRFLTIVN